MASPYGYDTSSVIRLVEPYFISKYTKMYSME